MMARAARNPLVFSGLRHGLAFRAGSYMDQHNTPSPTLQGIRRATVQHMRVDHRCSNILMAEKFLDRSNIVARFKQVDPVGNMKTLSWALGAGVITIMELVTGAVYRLVTESTWRS